MYGLEVGKTYIITDSDTGVTYQVQIKDIVTHHMNGGDSLTATEDELTRGNDISNRGVDVINQIQGFNSLPKLTAVGRKANE